MKKERVVRKQNDLAGNMYIVAKLLDCQLWFSTDVLLEVLLKHLLLYYRQERDT